MHAHLAEQVTPRLSFTQTLLSTWTPALCCAAAPLSGEATEKRKAVLWSSTNRLSPTLHWGQRVATRGRFAKTIGFQASRYQGRGRGSRACKWQGVADDWLL